MKAVLSSSYKSLEGLQRVSPESQRNWRGNGADHDRMGVLERVFVSAKHTVIMNTFWRDEVFQFYQ